MEPERLNLNHPLNIEGKILAVVGPAGAGKQYCFESIIEAYPGQVEVLPKITTRNPRPTDKLDTKCTSNEDFQNRLQAGEIFGAHQPFFPEDTNWYGYSWQDLYNLNGRPLKLVEPHVEYGIPVLKQLLGDKLHIISLNADPEYLAANMRGRGELKEEIEKRLKAQSRLTAAIGKRMEQGLIDETIELSVENRNSLKAIITEIAGRFISNPKVKD